MRSLLLHVGNEEVLQDGQGWAFSYYSACSVHWAIRFGYVLQRSMGLLSRHILCPSACIRWRWQMVVLLDFTRIDLPGSLSGSSRSLARGGPADGASGSCATE